MNLRGFLGVYKGHEAQEEGRLTALALRKIGSLLQVYAIIDGILVLLKYGQSLEGI